MGLLVVLIDNQDPAADVGAGTAERLAALGVTSLAVLRDSRTTALTLQGWTFDPDLSAEAAVAALATVGGALRVLRPVLESELHRVPQSRPARTG